MHLEYLNIIQQTTYSKKRYTAKYYRIIIFGTCMKLGPRLFDIIRSSSDQFLYLVTNFLLNFQNL